jgi:hypothetical protein
MAKKNPQRHPNLPTGRMGAIGIERQRVKTAKWASTFLGAGNTPYRSCFRLFALTLLPFFRKLKVFTFE